jgi:hypothetical protein
MSARRLTASVGVALLLGACVVGCLIPAVLRPGPPWRDVVAQQRTWTHEQAWLFGVAAIFMAAGYVLLAVAVTARRHDSRKSAEASDDSADRVS